MSLKRQMVKKNNALQSKMGRQKKLAEKEEESKETKKANKEAKLKRIEAKKMAQQLGNKKLASIHLDKYSNDFKNLIGKLNDEHDTGATNQKGNQNT